VNKSFIALAFSLVGAFVQPASATSTVSGDVPQQAGVAHKVLRLRAALTEGVAVPICANVSKSNPLYSVVYAIPATAKNVELFELTGDTKSNKANSRKLFVAPDSAFESASLAFLRAFVRDAGCFVPAATPSTTTSAFPDTDLVSWPSKKGVEYHIVQFDSHFRAGEPIDTSESTYALTMSPEGKVTQDISGLLLVTEANVRKASESMDPITGN